MRDLPEQNTNKYAEVVTGTPTFDNEHRVNPDQPKQCETYFKLENSGTIAVKQNNTKYYAV